MDIKNTAPYDLASYRDASVTLTPEEVAYIGDILDGDTASIRSDIGALALAAGFDQYEKVVQDTHNAALAAVHEKFGYDEAASAAAGALARGIMDGAELRRLHEAYGEILTMQLTRKDN